MSGKNAGPKASGRSGAGRRKAEAADPKAAAGAARPAQAAELEEILSRYPPIGESLIGVLQEIQARFHYLSEANLKRVAEGLQIPLPRVLGVATFYNAFSLKPKGETVIQVCLGTACHVRGAPLIVEEIERLLGVRRGNTTPDGRFTLETVNCLGACALGPIVVVDGEYHGNMTVSKATRLIGAGAGRKSG